MLNLTNQKFGKLTIVSLSSIRKTNQKYHKCWNYICECGSTGIASTSNLRKGRVRSCGCLQKERASLACTKRMTIHGMTKTRIYKIWQGMKSRCYNSKRKKYSRYGGRGITVCDRWLNSFENFYKDMIPTYKEDLTLDRIDNNGNYEPSNCRWATRSMQLLNTSKTVFVTYKGITKPLMTWAREFNLNTDTVYDRFYNNWPIERLFLTPIARKKYN